MMDQPNATRSQPTLHERVKDVIDRIRDLVEADGGGLELVDVTRQGVVKIRLRGACVGCPSSELTLRMGIEQNLRRIVPEISAVEQVP